MKISEAFSEYRKIMVRARGCSGNTDRGYEYTTKIFIEYFGDIRVRNLSVNRISEFYLDITGQTMNSDFCRRVSKNTAREYVMKLRSVLTFCHNKGVKTINPDDIVLPKPEKISINFLTISEFNIFLNEISTPKHGYSHINRARNELIAKLLYYTGLRVGELCALNRNSFVDNQCIIVGKSKYPRPVYITDELQEEIDQYLMLRDDNNEALFICNQTKGRITPHIVEQIFRRVSKNVSLGKVTPHTLRHSFATRLIDNGVDIRYVADFLGHQSLNTTKRYTHVRNFKLQQIYDQIFS